MMSLLSSLRPHATLGAIRIDDDDFTHLHNTIT